MPFNAGDWILLITLVVTIIFHVIFILISHSERRFQRFHDVTQRILDIGISIKDFNPKHYKLWDNAILNQAEYISYLVNKNKVNFKFLAGFLDTALIDYFGDIVLKRYKHRLKDKNYYPEFRKLHERLVKYRKNKERKRGIVKWLKKGW